MTSTRLRVPALAALLLGTAGLTGLTVPAAQAAREPAASTCVTTPSAAVRVGGVTYQRDLQGSVPAEVAAAVQRRLTSVANRRAVRALPGQTTFNVRAHILTGTSRADRRRHVTKRQVRRQVQWLNLAYAGGEAPGVAADTGVRFRLRSISVTKNNRWFHPRGFGVLNQMKKKLHRGNQRTLNLYFVSFPRTGLFAGLLGYSTFPWSYAAHRKLDGVVIAYNSVRGGTLAPYNEGDTAVHEVGHWLGLLHTFQGWNPSTGASGCDGTGDFVDDTPAEATPQRDCTQTDTCPLSPGVDPIHNFMDYSVDACMYMFTAGQTARIAQVVAAYRP